ncbi:MAG: YkgJ family cysteine cluster protein, partial [Alphaproteobacteria bacterium]
MPANLLKNYQGLLEQVDALAARISGRLGEHMVCGPGCSGCCRHISVLPVEAFALRRALEQADSDRQRLIRQQALASDGEQCPLLRDDQCLLYQARPVICRTQGLPLLLREDNGLRIDYCPLNFTDLETLPGELAVDLDRLNQLLVAVNLHFCQQTGTPVERQGIAEALSGRISPDRHQGPS